MGKVAIKLARKNGGHNKFLESICVWIEMKAPRYFWQQVDAYRIGVTKQSQSTMHTVLKNPLYQEDFARNIYVPTIKRLNLLIEKKDFESLKNELPEGFLQERMLCTNYKALYGMYLQRRNHKLEEWQIFCNWMKNNLDYWKDFFDD